MAVSDWSASASLNTTVGGVSIAPGCARANVDDGLRAIMAEAKAGFLEGLSVRQYGATGDGTTDDTAAITAAALAAATAGSALEFPNGTYLISDYIPIRNGVAAVIGKGGIIKCKTGSIAGLLLQGRNVGLSANVTGCRVEGMVIDLNATAGIGIYASNPIACRFLNNRIYGGASAQAGILIKAWNAGLEIARDNIIIGNLVDGIGNTGNSGISLQSEGTYAVDKTTIIGNRTFGWQYGVGATGATETLIQGLLTTGAVRCVSLQNGCDRSRVENSIFRDFGDNAVHIKSSKFVSVSDCYAETSTTFMIVSGGEGTFQGYAGAEDCTFTNCRTRIPTGQPEFHFYAGASASRTKFVNCHAEGVATRGYFCIESAYKYQNPVTTYSAFGRNKSGVVEADATNDTSDAGFDNCTANGSSPVPAFALLQTTLTAGTIRALTRPFVRNCRTIGDGYTYHLYLNEESASNLSGGIVDGFASPSGVSSGKFVLPRGTAHCAQVGGNARYQLNTITGTVTYANSWVADATSPLTVVRNGEGLVSVTGRTTTGTTTSGFTMFTLPAGFRPAVAFVAGVPSNFNAGGLVTFNLDGTVTINAAISATWADFNISFQAA